MMKKKEWVRHLLTILNMLLTQRRMKMMNIKMRALVRLPTKVL